MDIWICNGCHAEVTGGEPKNCPLCGQHQRGFSQAEKPEQDPEDRKYSELYKKTLEELQAYNEGCEPEELRYSCEL